MHAYFGKVFDNPTIVFDEPMLKPETQDLAAFVDGIDNIVEAQQRVALQYFEDGSVDNACPPLQGLLHIMAHGHYQGQHIDDPAFRNMFTLDYLLQSDWYRERLHIKQVRDLALWQRHAAYIQHCLDSEPDSDCETAYSLRERLATARDMVRATASDEYLDGLRGGPGADWIDRAQWQALTNGTHDAA